jgi:hypothetical protein
LVISQATQAVDKSVGFVVNSPALSAAAFFFSCRISRLRGDIFEISPYSAQLLGLLEHLPASQGADLAGLSRRAGTGRPHFGPSVQLCANVGGGKCRAFANIVRQHRRWIGEGDIPT